RARIRIAPRRPWPRWPGGCPGEMRVALGRQDGDCRRRLPARLLGRLLRAQSGKAEHIREEQTEGPGRLRALEPNPVEDAQRGFGEAQRLGAQDGLAESELALVLAEGGQRAGEVRKLSRRAERRSARPAGV